MSDIQDDGLRSGLIMIFDFDAEQLRAPFIVGCLCPANCRSDIGMQTNSNETKYRRTWVF